MKVATPLGPWEVLAVASPLRRGRTLYSLNFATNVQFTATHPLVNMVIVFPHNFELNYSLILTLCRMLEPLKDMPV